MNNGMKNRRHFILFYFILYTIVRQHNFSYFRATAQLVRATAQLVRATAQLVRATAQLVRSCDSTARSCDSTSRSCDSTARSCDSATRSCDSATRSCDSTARSCAAELSFWATVPEPLRVPPDSWHLSRSYCINNSIHIHTCGEYLLPIST